MNKQSMQMLIAQELDKIPKGGMPQNILRSVYQNLRENDLAKHDPPAPPGEVFHRAVAAVRKSYPEFVPTVSDSLYFHLEAGEFSLP